MQLTVTTFILYLKRGKGKKHLANATMATVGLGATAGLAYGGLKAMANADKFAIGKTLKKVFETIGEKVFGGKVGNIFKKVAAKPGKTVDVIADATKVLKGKAALVATAIVAGIGILAGRLYNAGKINAEKTVVVAEE